MHYTRALSICQAEIFASVDKGTRGFSRGKTAPGCVILVGGRQPACLVCLASRRLSSAKNSEGLAGTAGALPARQRTQACWRKSRTITPQAAFQPRPQARVPLSTDACVTQSSAAKNLLVRNEKSSACGAARKRPLETQRAFFIVFLCGPAFHPPFLFYHIFVKKPGFCWTFRQTEAGKTSPKGRLSCFCLRRKALADQRGTRSGSRSSLLVL